MNLKKADNVVSIGGVVLSFLLLLSNSFFSQVNTIFSIDTFYVKRTLYNHLLTKTGSEKRLAEKLMAKEEKDFTFQVQKTFDNLSTNYSFYKGEVTVSHSSNVICVWDMVRSTFIDSISVEIFNKIITRI
jgi:hypothetical protein